MRNPFRSVMLPPEMTAVDLHGPSHRHRGLSRALAQVAAANVIFTALSFITSPIAAHALGPVGRGRLAAIIVPFTWAPLLVNLGLPTYATRAAARGERLGDLIGTLGLASLALSVVGILLGIPLAYVLAPHDDLVREYILIGLILLPLNLITGVGLGLANGLQEWKRLNVMRLIPPVTTVILYIALVSTNSLTVAAAAVTVYASAVLAATPLLGLMRAGRPFRVDLSLLHRATAFGRRAWVGTLASAANNRLDQLLMIPLVSARQLGLYAVAVNVSGLSSLVLGAMNTVIGPIIAKGNNELIGTALRLTLFAVLIFSIGAGLVVPWMLPLVFGRSFEPAVPMCLILLGASIPGAGAWVLGSALQNAGSPGIPARGEVGALIVTASGLAVLLPPLAGVGAAIVSALAYTVNLTIQLALVRWRMRIPLRELLLIRREDLSMITQAVRRQLKRA